MIILRILYFSTITLLAIKMISNLLFPYQMMRMTREGSISLGGVIFVDFVLTLLVCTFAWICGYMFVKHVLVILGFVLGSYVHCFTVLLTYSLIVKYKKSRSDKESNGVSSKGISGE